MATGFSACTMCMSVCTTYLSVCAIYMSVCSTFVSVYYVHVSMHYTFVSMYILHILNQFSIARSVHNGSNAQLHSLAPWIQCTSDLLVGSIEQDVLQIGSSGQEMLCIGSSVHFHGMNERDIYLSLSICLSIYLCVHHCALQVCQRVPTWS